METIDEHETLSAVASLGLHLATRTAPAAHGRAVRDRDQLLEALGRGAVAIEDTVRIAGWTTTVGRHLVAACLPPDRRDLVELPWDALRGARAIAQITRDLHVEIATRCVTALEDLGRYVAERSGFSLALDDFLPPPEARSVTAEARADAARIQQDYDECLLTDGERHNKQVDVWVRAADLMRYHARGGAPEHDPLAACAASQRAPAAPDVLRTMVGVMVTSNGHTALELTGTLGTGLGTHEYFFRAEHRRRAALEAGERHRVAHEMLEELDAVLGEVAIVAADCGTAQGVRVRASADDNHTGSLARIIAGSVTAEELRDRSGAVLAPIGVLLVPALARQIEAAGISSVLLRDVRTCEAVAGVCARCFGLAPEDARWPRLGEGVGARAAAAIADAMRELLPRRITHIC